MIADTYLKHFQKLACLSDHLHHLASVQLKTKTKTVKSDHIASAWYLRAVLWGHSTTDQVEWSAHGETLTISSCIICALLRTYSHCWPRWLHPSGAWLCNLLVKYSQFFNSTIYVPRIPRETQAHTQPRVAQRTWGKSAYSCRRFVFIALSEHCPRHRQECRALESPSTSTCSTRRQETTKLQHHINCVRNITFSKSWKWQIT